MTKPNPIGATFAERKAAAEGKKTFTAPTPAAPQSEEGSTFASRAKAAKKSTKAVEADDEKAENKAVKSSETKKS